MQYAALAALEPANEPFVVKIREQLHRQREVAMKLLEKVPHISFVAPTGAFYLFPDVSGLFTKSFQGQPVENVDRLAELLLEHAHIAVVPGSAFGSDCHVRISYAIPVDEIASGLTSLERFVLALA